jgi:predicted deacylase
VAGVQKTWLREEHAGAPPVEFPLVEVLGSAGPTVSIVAGMHPGEYAGVIAAGQLARELARSDGKVRGRILIIPILSTQAFFQRAIQLSPVDEREPHYVWPGNPGGSYTEHLVDLLFRTIETSDAVLDLHGGEFTQDLTPYVGTPWEGDGPLYDRSVELASAFDVPFADRRVVAETANALPRALNARGIPNIWTEIGHNGLPEPSAVRTQYEGCVNALRLLAVLDGKAIRHPQRLVGPRHWSVHAERSGVWVPEIRAGDHVREGQVLGRQFDVFGDEIEVFRSPADALAEYVCTSPAINADRRPFGNQWHQHLAQLVEDPAGQAAA